MVGNSPSSSLADTGIKFVDIVGKIANVALKVDRGIEGVDAIIGPFAGFIPYYSQAMAVAKIADPILDKIATYAPQAEGLIEAGRPIIDLAQAEGPVIVEHVKGILNLALGEAGMPAGFNPDAVLAAFGAQVFAGTKLQGVWEASFFTPQDPRFASTGIATQS